MRIRCRHPFLIGACAGAMCILPWTAQAQEQPPPDVRAIAAALADEQTRIIELQAELERRSVVLAELRRRLEAIAGEPIPTASPQTSAAPPPTFTEKSPVMPAPATAPRFELYGDTKFRYDALNQDYPGCIGCPDRKRGRLRLRFGTEGRLSPDFRAVMGLSAGEIDDSNTVYANLGNKFSRKVVTWDRGFIESTRRKHGGSI